MANEKILVVDDDANICELLRLYLTKEGYQVTVANDGEEGLEKFNQVKPDMVLLDVMMPKMDGLEVCRRIRRVSSVPILMITAKDEDADRILGLDIGADDYICKPYDIDILIAKINGIFKRKYALDEIVCDNLKLNNVTQTLTVNQTPVNVTEKEFQLLKLLVENKGTTLKKEYLFNRIWGSNSESEPQTLTVHIKWLREKIEQDSKKPKHIITVWGTGYRYE